MTFKKPNLTAPRFRPTSKKVLNRKTYEAFLKKHPQHAEMSLEQFKKIVVTYNEEIWHTVLHHRDGVKLPEDLGYLIGSKYKRKKDARKAINFGKSVATGEKVLHRNWETDGYAPSLNYTNYSLKYRFKNRELWSFEPTRDFKRTFHRKFAELYRKYIHLTNGMSLATLYKLK